jgi:hypothetical protein
MYRCRWEGSTPFRLKCNFFKKPPEHHPYSFALAAEAAWSDYAWQRSQAEFAGANSMTFSVNDRGLVRVGQGVLHFEVGERREQIQRDEIARASLSDGVLRFRRRDAKWSRRAGKFEFRYEKTGNARVFVRALKKLLSITLDETARVEEWDNVI